MPYIDLTQTFTSNMSVYPGDAASELTQVAFLDKDSVNDHRLVSGMHVGTHLDAPWHMIENGKKISDFAPDKFFGQGVLIDARDKQINADLLQNLNLDSNSIVLVLTGHLKKFRNPDYYETMPEVQEDFAKILADKKIKILGLDTPTPDSSPFSIHKILLNQEVLIVENLTNLESLLGVDNFEVITLPLKIEANASFVRVVAKI
jgi:kynurenine formamidase